MNIIPGMRLLGKWRGARKPPMNDPSKSPVEYMATFRLVTWDGDKDGHFIDECHCPNLSDTGQGRHEELRPDGLNFSGVHFNSLSEALENQVFAAWYKDNKEVVDDDQIVVREPLYKEGEEPRRGRYGFLLHEHAREMTYAEINLYKRTGDIPSRFKVGRAK